MSRHLTEYYIVPAGAVIRINLAWEESLTQLRRHLDELTHHVFLDVPCGRKKPPTNHYRIKQILNILQEYPAVRYLGISQVDSAEHLMAWIANVPEHVQIIPKIESMEGCKNIEDIIVSLKMPVTIMLDHDDLFSDLVSQGFDSSQLYTGWIEPLLRVCNNLNVKVLRTAGIVFTDR
jgi:hypothetical protein